MDAYGQPMDAYGQPVDAYGQPVEGEPGHGAPGAPPTMPYLAAPGLKPPKPPSRWKAWHKVTLGVIGALTLCLCGVAVFAPDSNTGNPTDKEQTAAAQQVADVPSTPTDDPATASPTRATTPATTPAAATPATKAPVTKTSKPTPKPTTTKAVYYATCADAPGPLSKGKPGYRKALDRDGDGVACERSGDDEEPPADDPPADDPGDDDSGGGTDPRYSSCTKAKADGYGPYYKGQDPEYDWYQDRDNDGVVCE
ncbi:excalibur calcium-binding domain-containing protein [Actinoplanes sp. CA-131856]